MPQIYLLAISGDGGSSGTSNWFERNFNHQLMKRKKQQKNSRKFIELARALFCVEMRKNYFNIVETKFARIFIATV